MRSPRTNEKQLPRPSGPLVSVQRFSPEGDAIRFSVDAAWPAGKIFPATITYRVPAGVLASKTGLGLSARRVGIASQAGISLYYLGHAGAYAAIFLPWAGYFNAKVIFWRRLFTSG